ncbi:MAG TPA: hypothetical protein VF553_18905 [Pyrinomonadaceae bacterium]|jgi:hypothetical protein
MTGAATWGASPLISGILVLSWGLTFVVGQAEAINQRNFLVINTSPEMAVLRIYGDNMSCAPFNRETKEVQKSFVIIKAADNPKHSFNLEDIGPLKPVEITTQVQPVPLPVVSPRQ